MHFSIITIAIVIRRKYLEFLMVSPCARDLQDQQYIIVIILLFFLNSFSQQSIRAPHEYDLFMMNWIWIDRFLSIHIHEYWTQWLFIFMNTGMTHYSYSYSTVDSRKIAITYIFEISSLSSTNISRNYPQQP